jgi:hypothetical protein
VEEDSTTKNFYKDSIGHEVKYDPTDKKSDTYKSISNLSLTVLLNNRSNSWRTSTSSFLANSSLKGEALCIFNDKAVEQEEEMRDTHIKCLCAITEQTMFPKDNPLLKQKTYMFVPAPK